MGKKAKKINFFVVSVFIIMCLSLFTFGCSDDPKKEYGVFIGINAEDKERLDDYSLVVIEPSEFQAEHIDELHAKGKKVYGYVNIGSLEEYRPYYDRFKHLAIDTYENWSDESWIDVSSSEWQSFVVDELCRQYANMGLDGFFLDNTDVYYLYPTDDIFKGLCSILKGLKAYDIPLIINGGDTFVTKCIDDNSALSLFDGINQETVFTCIDFDNKTYGKQQEEDTIYFQDYIAKAKNCGLSVYLLEYGADKKLSEEIESFCKENGFLWYNADSLELK